MSNDSSGEEEPRSPTVKKIPRRATPLNASSPPLSPSLVAEEPVGENEAVIDMNIEEYDDDEDTDTMLVNPPDEKFTDTTSTVEIRALANTTSTSAPPEPSESSTETEDEFAPDDVARIVSARKITVFRKTATEIKNELDIHRSVALKALPELSFNVLKIHHKLKQFKKQKRILKITGEGILNCKKSATKGIKPTRSFAYKDIMRVMLVDTDNFIIQYDNAHAFYYQSPLAIQITQLISSRLTKRMNLERFVFAKLDNSVAMKYQSRIRLNSLLVKHELEEIKSEKERLLKRHQRGNILELPPESFPGDYMEQQLWADVLSVCLNKKSIEGKTIASFMKNFPVMERNHPGSAIAASTRQFINGMRDYVLNKRKVKLEELYNKALTRSQTLAQKESPLAIIVENTLQRAIISPLKSSLERCLYDEEASNPLSLKQREAKLKSRMSSFATKDQAFFGVPPAIEKLGIEWNTTINILKTLESTDIPADIAKIVLFVAKAIYLEHSEHSSKEEAQFLSADDFLPILVYVIAKSGLTKPCFYSDYLWELGDTESLGGESGYYATMFSSAINALLATNEDGSIEDSEPESE